MNLARIHRLAVAKVRSRAEAMMEFAQPEPPDPKEIRLAYEGVAVSDNPEAAMSEFVAKYGMERFVQEAVLHGRHPDRKPLLKEADNGRDI